jgi:serine/threonine-protein kinase
LGTDLTISGLLGEGGTATVYRAHHAVLGREVAVKVPSAPTAYAHERLMREAQMCATVRDVHVPRIYALDKLPDGRIYIVMEKVPGEPLSRLAAGRRLPVRQAVQIACATLDAVHAVHRKGIVHRDVKPSNLLVDLSSDPPDVRLLDFGVGKVVSSRDLRFPDLTCKGELLGTPMYMAPEQMLGDAVDGRTDLYAVGVILYELLAGRTPYPATTIAEVFAAALRDEAPPLASLRAGLPSSMLEFVSKAMSRRPDERFDSAREMQKALVAAHQDLRARPDLVALAELEELLADEPHQECAPPSTHGSAKTGTRKAAARKAAKAPVQKKRAARGTRQAGGKRAAQASPPASRSAPRRRRQAACA